MAHKKLYADRRNGVSWNPLLHPYLNMSAGQQKRQLRIRGQGADMNISCLESQQNVYLSWALNP